MTKIRRVLNSIRRFFVHTVNQEPASEKEKRALARYLEAMNRR